MRIGIGIGITSGNALPSVFSLDPVFANGQVTIKLDSISTQAFAFSPPQLSAFTIDNVGALSSLDASTPATAVDVNTRAAGSRGGGGAVIEAADAAEFVPGQCWLMLYEITAADEGVDPPFAPASSPFAEVGTVVNMPGGLGRHAVIVTVRDGYTGSGTVALLRSGSGGSTTYANLGLYRAEWMATLPDQPERGPEMASATGPITVTNGGQVVASPTAPLEIGERYELVYEITAAEPGAGLFTPGSTAFASESDPPASVGTHKVVWVCESLSTEPFLRSSSANDITISSLSLKKVITRTARELSATVSAFDRTASAFISENLTRDVHVATSGDDVTGDGSAGSPYATPKRAASLAQPGDTITVAAGTYTDPIQFRFGGLPSAPVTLIGADAPDFDSGAIIDGLNFDQIGADGICVDSVGHVHLRKLLVRNWTVSGIKITADALPDGNEVRDFVVANCKTEHTGGAGIAIVGSDRTASQTWPPLGTTRVRDVLIENNDVSYTNMVTPHNQSFGVEGNNKPGGKSESITVTGGVGNVITRYNDVHDSRQYGIDYKTGVIGGEIYGNRVWNMLAYGIYLDSSVREVENVKVYDNTVWGCTLGIVLAREGRMDPGKTEPPIADRLQTLRNIEVHSNSVFNCGGTAFFFGIHPGDGPYGAIENITIRDNVFYNAGRADDLLNELRLVDLTPLTDSSHPNGDGASVATLSNIVVQDNIAWRDPLRGDPRVFDEWTGKSWATFDHNINFAAPFSDPGFLDVDGATAQDVSDAITAGYVTPANYGQWAIGAALAANPNGYVDGDTEWEDPTYEPWMTQAEGELVDLSVTIQQPANTVAPSITPTSATVDDQPFTRVAGTYTGNPVPAVTWVWRKGTTQIPGSLNEATYTPDEPRSDYNVFETATNSQGSVNAGSASASASLRTQATMALSDQSFNENTGNQTYDIAPDVTANGNALTYVLLSPPTGVTIAGSVITVDTTVVPVSTEAITVRATDEYGRNTNDSFDLVISAATVTEDFAIQHVAPAVVAAGGTQAITAVDLNGAFILNNHSVKQSSGQSANDGTGMAPDELGLGARLTASDTITLDRESTALLNTNTSLSVLEYIGDPGGANEFIVRDRRTVALTGASDSFTPSGIVNADKCIPIITGQRSSRPNASNWDHALAATSINRSTGEVTVDGRGSETDGGTLTVEITTVEFTGSNWTVHYATENADTADTGTLTLSGSVASWANAWIMHQLGKNGGNQGGGDDINSIYKPGSALNQVDWEFVSTHTGVSGQRHTVYVLENPNMTVTRFQHSVASSAPVTGDIDVSSLGLTLTTEALLYISTTISDTGANHPRGQRTVRFTDENTVRHFAQNTGSDLEVEVQVIQLPNLGSPSGGSGSSGGSSSGSLPAVPEYPDSNFTVINLAAGANIQSTIDGLSSLAGVKIKLAAGNYASFEVDSAQHGNATLANPFVIEGPASGTARIQDNASDDTVLIAGSDHVILDRLYIEGAPNSSRAALHVRLKNTGIYPEGFQLLRSTIARREGDGIKFSEVIDVLVDTVVFSDDLNASSSGERHLDFNKFDNIEVYRCEFRGHRAMNVKGGSRNAVIADCAFVNCVNTVEIGENPGTGYWTLFDGIRNWSVLGTSITNCTFDNCTGTNIKFKDVHDFTATGNRQLSSGPGATDATYSYVNGNQVGQSTYQNSNIVVDGVQTVPAI